MRLLLISFLGIILPIWVCKAGEPFNAGELGRSIFNTSVDFINVQQPPTAATTTKSRNADLGKYASCGLQKECLPRSLCKNNMVNTDGTDLIDIRAGAGPRKPGECGYLEVCCFVDDKIEDPKDRYVPPVKHVGCGYRNPDGVGYRLLGTTNEAEFGEFPWMAAILRKDDVNPNNLIYTCGAAILAPTVIITGAHCVKNRTPDEFALRVGEWDTQTEAEILPHYDMTVKEIIMHEQFNKGSLWNDVALLILEQPLQWAENIRPICLPPSNTNFDYAKCFVTGWGKDKFGNDGLYQAILKKIQLPIVPHAQCQSSLRTTRVGHYFNLHDSFICAGGEKGKDVCTGDGGSPLVCPIPGAQDRFYHAGIVAWGIGCGEEGIPGIYGSVGYLRDWIDTKLKARGIDFSYFTI